MARVPRALAPFKGRVGWGRLGYLFFCSSSFPRKREFILIFVLFLASAELPLALGASGLLLALPKSRQKARRLTRCPAARHARRGVPALLAFAGSLRRHIPCAASRSRQSLAATLRAFSREGCDARHRERRRDPRIRASLHCLDECSERLSASAAGCRPNRGPLRRGEGAQEKSEGGRTRCAPVR